MAADRSSNWLKLVDEESGLYNRLYLIHHLTEAFARARRYGLPVSCLLFQAKWWRGTEDISVAPLAAGELGRFLLLNVREGDILGRWATNEYLLIAANTPPEGLHALIDIIAAKAETFSPGEPPDLAVSVHAGVAGLPGDEKKLRHAETMPLLARERLSPVFRAGRFNGNGCAS